MYHSGVNLKGYSLAGLAPHAQVDPETLAFSVEARSQVHSPAGRAPIQSSRQYLAFKDRETPLKRGARSLTA